MANNRMYLYDNETNEAMMLAKSFGTWTLWASEKDIQEFIDLRDFDSACNGRPSKLSLKTEGELPADVVIVPLQFHRPTWWTRIKHFFKQLGA